MVFKLDCIKANKGARGETVKSTQLAGDCFEFSSVQQTGLELASDRVRDRWGLSRCENVRTDGIM